MPSSAGTLLLVEDDRALAPLVLRHMRESGYEMLWAQDVDSADATLRQTPIDLVVLDLMLPGEDGLTFCRRLRKAFAGGIIMVTARGEESDRIMGLSIGADDYLPKPFSLWELEARVRAVMRRSAPHTRDKILEAGELKLEIASRRLWRQGRSVELTRSEFDVLALLMSDPGRVFPRERLLEAIQGGESEAFDRAVDTHISNLRKKIEADPRAPRHIKTVWGVGYQFEVT